MPGVNEHGGAKARKTPAAREGVGVLRATACHTWSGSRRVAVPPTGRVISPSSGIHGSWWRRSPRRPTASEARTTPTTRAYKLLETRQSDPGDEPD